jgi:hypothetical protein
MPIDRKALKILFLIIWVIVVVALLLWMPLLLKVANPQQRSECVQ